MLTVLEGKKISEFQDILHEEIAAKPEKIQLILRCSSVTKHIYY
jgi:hypothetical protein